MHAGDLQSIKNFFANSDNFSALDGAIRDELSNYCRLTVLDNTEQILVSQAVKNTHLHFLIHGSFRVEVDRSPINVLDTPGETVGEISWVTNSNATASVVAEAGSQFLSVSFSDLDSINAKFNGKLKEYFIKIFPTIITKRLVSTNNKAKRVVELIEKLRATEESLRLMNETLEYQIARKERETHEQIQYLASKVLPKLINYVTHSKKNWNSYNHHTKSLLDEFDLQLNQVKTLLSGLITFQDQTEMLARVVGFGLGTREESALNTVLSSFGLQSVATDRSHGNSSNNEPQNLSQKQILISGTTDISNLPTNKLFNQKILLLKDLNLVDLKGATDFDVLIHCGLESRSALIRTLTTALNKVIFDNIWGLQKYLSWGTKIYNTSIVESNKRAETIEIVLNKFRESRVRSAILNQIQLVLEELLMNAIYDAPTDIKGNPLYNHMARSNRVSLPENKEVMVYFGTDGITAGISVTDPFGSLTKETILSYLELGAKGVDAYNSNKGGAGKGLYLIVSNAVQTIFNVEKGRKTEVICLFDLDRNNMDRSSDSPSFHFYFK